MSQSLPVLTGSGSLLGITESPQAAFVGGVKGDSSASVFSTVMSQADVQQKVEASSEHQAGGDALPSGGAELPPDTVRDDGLDRLNGNYVAVDGSAGMAETASMEKGLVSPNQAVEQIERFLAVELNVEQHRSEFSRPEVAKSFASFEVATQANTLPGTIWSSGIEKNVSNSLPSVAGDNRVTMVSGPAGLHPVMPSNQAELKAEAVLSEYSAGRSPQIIDAVQGAQGMQAVQRESAVGVKQSPVPSGISEPVLQTAGLETVKTFSVNEQGMPVGVPVQANDSLVRPSSFVESAYIPRQGELLQQAVSQNSGRYVPAISSEKGGDASPGPVFSDPAEQVVAAVRSEGEAKVAAVSLAGVPVVDAAVASERQKQSAERSVGRDGVSGRAPLDAASITSAGTAVNSQESESNSSLVDRLARPQPAAMSQVEQNQLQRGGDLPAVDKMIADKGTVEHKSESSVEALAASMAATAKAAKPQSEVVQLQMPNGLKPGMQAWNQAVNERIVLLPSQNGRIAEIQLDPPELGSLQIKLQVKNDQVNVVFVTPHGAVRDALEQGMPRLREMFAEQGLSLTDSSVEDQSSGHEREDSSERQSAFAGNSGFDDEVDGPITAVSQSAGLSLVDYYA